jgi:NADPH:quinone reductase-like Zn-dependent oxidoreductase
MRAVVLRQYGDPATSLTVEDIPKPALKRGQVLVRIVASPMHPADMAFVEGNYGVRRQAPTVPGLEGMGVVVEANAGAYGRWLMGKRVSCFGPNEGNGAWAEYMATSAFSCVPLASKSSDAFGATLLVNPLTAISQMAMVRRERHRAFVQTAAGSALGRMIVRLARMKGIPAIHVVRRSEGVAALRSEGAEHMVVSSAPDFSDRLRELCMELGATIAFDAVAGEMTEILAAALPHGGKVVVYGGLSGRPPRISIADTIFRGKRMEGFWLPLEVKRIGMLGTLMRFREAQRIGETVLGTKILARLPLEGIADAIAMQPQGTEGKVLLTP